jgi:hypothetical protein
MNTEFPNSFKPNTFKSVDDSMTGCKVIFYLKLPMCFKLVRRKRTEWEETCVHGGTEESKIISKRKIRWFFPLVVSTNA